MATKKQNSPPLRVPMPVARMLLVLLGVVLGAAMLEGGSRLLWKAPWYEQLLAEQRRIQLYEYRVNSLSLRDRDYAPAKPPGKKRILILGDSFTYGMGVPDDEDIFPEIIERRLNALELETAPDGVEVLNAGLPATLTGHWVDLLEKTAAEFQPDVVLVVFFLRDGTRVMFIPEFFMKIRAEIVARNERSVWYQKFYSFRLLRDALDRRDISRIYTQRFLNAYFGNDTETREWQVAQDNLLRLRDFARNHSADMGLVVFPVLVQLTGDYPFQAICDLLADFCGTNDIPVHDLMDGFRGQNASQLWVSPWDQHPNPRGHALVAESLMPFVLQMLGEEPGN